MGVIIANEIFPEAMDYLKGTVAQKFIEDEDNEEDDEDGDEDEIDLEKPGTKKQRPSAARPMAHRQSISASVPPNTPMSSILHNK